MLPRMAFIPAIFGANANPLTGLLPYVDQTPLFQVVTGSNAPDSPVHPPIYICPSDPMTTAVKHSLSYVMNDGNGLQSYGHNGMFVGHIRPDWTEPGDPLRLANVTDGLSNTASFSEWLIEETYRVSPERKTNPKEFRTAWYTNTGFYGPNDLELFANECLHNRFPNPNYVTHVPLSQPDLNGGSVGYHHVLPPNSPSCWNGPPGGIQPPELTSFRLTSASSLHPRGANLLMADGVVRFVSNDIDRRVWSAWGSRNGNETASNGY